MPRAAFMFQEESMERSLAIRIGYITMSTLKTALREAHNPEEIVRDPTFGIGQNKYTETEVRIFTMKGMKELLGEVPGVWTDLSGCVAYILAAQVGLRRGKILALIWGRSTSGAPSSTSTAP